MSFRASHWAVHEVRGLRPVEKILLLVLSEYADDRDCAWPSQERLADDVETSVSTLRRSLRRLEVLGLITREHRWVMDASGDTHRASNVYRLHVGATPDWGAVGGPGDGPSGRVRSGADVRAGGPGTDDTPIPVKMTGMGANGAKVPVDNSGGLGLFVGNADTGQDDRYGGATRPYRSKQGGIPVTQVTGISTPNRHLEPPDLTSPDVGGSPARPETDSVGSGPGGAGSSSGEPAAPAAGGPVGALVPHDRADQDRLLIAQCLPERMRVMDAAGLVVVAGLLRERLAAGWRPAEIRALMDQDLPERVRRLSSLVASRLRRNVDPGAAPLRDSAVARAAEESRQETSRRRSVELAGTPRRPEESDDRWAWEQVRREMPDASRLEQAMAVIDLVERRAAEGVAS